jgi:hypothetical protein
MNLERAEKVANAVLYEGYMLYPYRPSAMKNHQRWNFGTLYPAQCDEVQRGTERAALHVECLLQASRADVQIAIRVRFLQLGTRPDAQGWDEAVERVVEFKVSSGKSASGIDFRFPGCAGELRGSVRFSLTKLDGNLAKMVIDLVNQSPSDPSATRDQALRQSLLSAHLVLYADRAEFVSLLDPADSMRVAVASCKNVGVFPVLVGDEGERNILLCSPIILYDYPQIAPESAGDFFDGTEMDEMLTLRVMTMTEEEKNEMRKADDRARILLERTEQTAREQLMRTHGTIRSMRPANRHE